MLSPLLLSTIREVDVQVVATVTAQRLHMHNDIRHRHCPFGVIRHLISKYPGKSSIMDPRHLGNLLGADPAPRVVWLLHLALCSVF